MSATTAGAIGVALMLVMLFLGMPLSFTFAFSGVVGVALILGWDAGLSFLSTIPFTSVHAHGRCGVPREFDLGCL